MPNPEKLQEMIELSLEVEKYRLLHREAMNNFTSHASKLNYMLLEEHDYYQYITNRMPIPEWLKELPSKAWMFEVKPIKPRQHSRRKPKKKEDKAMENLYSKLMEGFK